jgi:excisionase family DNA binding protein
MRQKPIFAPQQMLLLAQPTQGHQAPVDPLAVNVEQAAFMLNISRATLFRLVKNGEIQGKKFGRRRVFSIVELQKLLA